MAVKSIITVNEVLIVEVDLSPITDPVEAPVGSLAMLGDSSGLMWVKTGVANNDWTKVHQGKVAEKEIPVGMSNGDISGSGNLIWENSVLKITGASTISKTLTVALNTIVGNLISNGFLRPSNTSDNTLGNIRLGSNNRLQGLDRGIWRNLTDEVYENEVYATASSGKVTTTSNSFQIISDIDITPPEGTYLVLATCSTSGESNNATGEIGLLKNSTLDGNSVRQFGASGGVLGTVGNSYIPSLTGTIVACNGSDTIHLAYRRTNGTVGVDGRQMVMIRYI